MSEAPLPWNITIALVNHLITGRRLAILYTGNTWTTFAGTSMMAKLHKPILYISLLWCAHPEQWEKQNFKILEPNKPKSLGHVNSHVSHIYSYTVHNSNSIKLPNWKNFRFLPTLLTSKYFWESEMPKAVV